MKYLILPLLIFVGFLSQAQLAITEGGVEYVINFDATVANVNPGQYEGKGFNPAPEDGQLNSNAWAVAGVLSGDLDFGGTAFLEVYRRGVWNGNSVAKEGIYAFEITSNNHAFGVQPDGNNFTPGSLTLRVLNQAVDGYIEALNISYTALGYNDENNSNSIKFAISKDNETFFDFPELDYITEEVKPGGNDEEWEIQERSLQLKELLVAPGDFFYLKWNFDVEWENFDVLANGNNDKLGVDNIVIEADTTSNPAPLIEDITYSRYPTSIDVVPVSAKVFDIEGDAIDSVNVLYWKAASTDTISLLATTTDLDSIFKANIPAFSDLDSVYFAIQATDVGGAVRRSAVIGYLVRNPVVATLPYNQYFVDSLYNCYPISVKGDQKGWYWYQDLETEPISQHAEVSGFYSGEEEEDWLILPGFTLSAAAEEIMSFTSYYNFGSDGVGTFDLLYSFDYPGAGLPGGYTWDTLQFSRPIEERLWYFSESIKLPDGDGVVYVAFKYTNPAFDYRTWRIDNLNVEENVNIFPEPSEFPTNFTASGINGSTIVTTWTDSQGPNYPNGYHVVMNKTGVFTAPTDSIAITDDLNFSDGTGSRNFFYGYESITWAGLEPDSAYYFAIYPYSNTGDLIDYKLGGAPRADTVTVPGTLSAFDDVMITEFMSDPRDVSDSDGEWFEIFNTTDSPININGWTIESSGADGTERHTIVNGGPLNILAKDFLVLSLNADTLSNGGVPVDYEYKNIFMSNTEDTVRIITDGGVFIDFIEWDDGAVWENPEARTLMFTGTPGQDNNDGNLWRPALMREKGYTFPLQGPTNLAEHDLGSPGTNGMYQNLNVETTWTGTGDWSNGNREGFNNWSNGSPGYQTKVTIDGNVWVDMPEGFPALCGELIINAGDTLIILPEGAVTTGK